MATSYVRRTVREGSPDHYACRRPNDSTASEFQRHRLWLHVKTYRPLVDMLATSTSHSRTSTYASADSDEHPY